MSRATWSRNHANLMRPVVWLSERWNRNSAAAIVVGGPCLDGRGEFLVEPLELGDPVVGDPRGGGRCQLLGDGGLQPEDVLDVATAQRCDDVAAVGLEHHHPFAPQREQRLADRGDAHAQLGGGLVEPDEGARQQRAGHDRGPQMARRPRRTSGPGVRTCAGRGTALAGAFTRPPSQGLSPRRPSHSVTEATQYLIKYHLRATGSDEGGISS